MKWSLLFLNFVNKTDVSSNGTISFDLLLSGGRCMLLWFFLTCLVEFTWLQGVVWWTLRLRPCPIWHDHTFRAVWGADAASVSDKELVTSIEPSSIRIVAMCAGLCISMADVIAVWHDASLWAISFLDELEKIWASSVNRALLKRWSISIIVFPIFSIGWFLIMFFFLWVIGTSWVLALALGLSINFDGDIFFIS